MITNPSEKTTDTSKQAILVTACQLFLEKGYTATSLREIAKKSGVNIGSLIYLFENKQNILCELVNFVLEEQFKSTTDILQGITDDKILFWATETTLQLYMAEKNEYIRELYVSAYSLPKSSSIIYQSVAAKMESYLKTLHPTYEAKDFYELEIATSGIIRGFMSVPCDMYFTMERKVKRFLESAFAVYDISKEKTHEAIHFVSQFDFEKLSQQVIDTMLASLEQAVPGTEIKLSQYN